MKPQDIAFLLVFIFFLYKHSSKWTTIAGLLCIAFSIPLFAFHIFFTAEHVTWYAAGFFLLSIGILFFQKYKQI